MRTQTLFSVVATAVVSSTITFAGTNDECTGATAVGVGATAFDTTGSTSSAEAWACASGGSDLWYTFTSTISGSVNIETCGSAYDTALEVFSGNCGALALIQCNDDACGLQSAVSTTSAPAGTTYIFRVGGFAGGAGPGTITVSETPATIPNDECTGAINVGVGSTAFDTTGATTSSAWPCALGGSDLWYSITAVTTGDITVETCGSGYDTCLEAFDGTCGALTSIVCNDDSCGLQSRVQISGVTAGTTYLVRVGGFNGGTGAGALTVDQLPVPGEECSSALPLGVGVTPFDSTGFTTSPEPWPCALGGSDIWYLYTATSDSDIVVETCGSAYDTALEAFSGACGALTSIICNDDSCGLQSRVTVSGLTTGDTFYVRVGGFNGQFGAGMLTVTETAPPVPPAVNCVESIFAANNQGSVGGAVYFDVTLTQAISIPSITVNTNVLDAGIGADLWMFAGSHVGNETAAGWVQVGTGDLLGTGQGRDNRTELNFTSPVALPAGTMGLAVVGQGIDHAYTNGDGTNQNFVSGDGVITIDLGSASNVPFTAGIFSPRIFNGGFCDGRPRVGTNYCVAELNSSGNAGVISGTGSPSVSANNLELTASNLPMGSFGIFIASQTQAFVPLSGGGQGNLCLGGDVGRGIGGAIFNSGTTGSFSGTVDATAIPQPMGGPVAIMAGETWNFQAWFRDANPMTTFNYTDGLEVLYYL